MNLMTIIGIILIALGVVGLIYGGITYTSSESVVDMGSMHLQVDQERHIPLTDRWRRFGGSRGHTDTRWATSARRP